MRECAQLQNWTDCVQTVEGASLCGWRDEPLMGTLFQGCAAASGSMSRRGTQQADSYHLRKEGVSKPWDTQTPLDSRDTVGFSIESMSAYTAGRFRCVYHSSGGWSEPSDPLHLVVTGAYSKPSQPSQALWWLQEGA
ncbi:leukocyte immunoglobulin-like receptor subfamily A member 5 isoform X1 [Tamandua tetradactyla]|uniref:leukocyte immunoglobulin-like receptor subfamily A member 5 isoform X1 n=1 Tax=Tamandua tetradactyla TaxID=48850 RepID=UPI0040546080